MKNFLILIIIYNSHIYEQLDFHRYENTGVVMVTTDI